VTTEKAAYRLFLRRLRRWHEDRCALCGHRFAWREGRFSNGPGTGPQHEPCNAARHWRIVADERLIVFDVVSDVWGIKSESVTELMALRYPDATSHSGWNLAWRVFRDLDLRRTAVAPKPDPKSSDTGSVLVSLLLAVCIVGGLLGLVFIGERAMCAVHTTPGDRPIYCESAEAQR
jgi:hypothetical protein